MNENKNNDGIIAFFDRNKWKIIIPAALILMAAIMILNINSKKKYDIYALYIGSQFVDTMVHEDFTSALADFTEGDFYDDGEINVSFSPMLYLTQEDMDRYDENDLYYNRQTNVETLQEFYRTIAVGTYIVIMMDDIVYEELKAKETPVLAPLSDIFTEVPENAFDEYAFYLKDTPLGAKLSENSDLPFPENTVICVRSFPYIASMVGKEEKQKQYDYQIELFKNITCESVKDTND